MRIALPMRIPLASPVRVLLILAFALLMLCGSSKKSYAQDFALTVSPTAVSVNQGSTGTSQASVTYSGGFTGAVALSASGLPSGVTASFRAPIIT